MYKIAKKLLSVCLSLVLGVSTFCVPFKEKTVIAAGYNLSNPRLDSSGVTTWDCVYFGNYWQNDTNGDGVANKKDAKQPIKWRVLSVAGNDAFVMADQNLDYQAYDDYDEYRDNITWEICTLRQWLNDDFYHNAFDSNEQSAIRTSEVTNEDNQFFGTKGGKKTSDKVYMLSLNEVWNPAYGFSSEDTYSETRVSKNTAYAKACGAGNGFWWLRTPGSFQYFAAIVMGNGDVAYAGSAVGTLNLPNTAESKWGVRPVLHLNLSSVKWSKAGTVSATIAGSREEDKAPEEDDKSETPKPNGGIGMNTTPQGQEQTESKKTTGTISQPRETKTKVEKPGKVVICSAKNKRGKKIVLSWKKVKGANGYELQCADNRKLKKKKRKQISKTKYVIKKCKKRKTYYIRIHAYKLDGKKKVYGNWSKVKKVKVRK